MISPAINLINKFGELFGLAINEYSPQFINGVLDFAQDVACTKVLAYRFHGLSLSPLVIRVT